MKPIRAGKYRHRITIQRKTEVVDPVTGYRTEAWADYLTALPAEFIAGPGREYLAAESIRSEVQGRLSIRWSPEAAAIQSHDRVLWDGRLWELKSDPLPDETTRKELTLMIGTLNG